MFAPFWSENGYRLYLFWSESREFGNARPYLSFEFEMNKTKSNRQIRNCLRADVSYFLCCTRATKEIGDVCTQANSKWLLRNLFLGVLI